MHRIVICSPLALAIPMVFALSFGACGAETAGYEKKPAVVVVHLPADAELIIAGVTSKQQTAVRKFDTPPLAPGKRFSYVLKAAWKDGNKEMTRVRTIFVTSGETTTIDLLVSKPAPSRVEKIPAPELLLAKEPKSTPEPTPIAKPEPKKEP